MLKNDFESTLTFNRPCWSLRLWPSSPSRFYWAAGCRHRRTLPMLGRGWRTWGGSHCSPHLLHRENNKKLEWKHLNNTTTQLPKTSLCLSHVTDISIEIISTIVKHVLEYRSTYAVLQPEVSHTTFEWVRWHIGQRDIRACPLGCCFLGQSVTSEQTC